MFEDFPIDIWALSEFLCKQEAGLPWIFAKKRIYYSSSVNFHISVIGPTYRPAKNDWRVCVWTGRSVTYRSNFCRKCAGRFNHFWSPSSQKSTVWWSGARAPRPPSSMCTKHSPISQVTPCTVLPQCRVDGWCDWFGSLIPHKHVNHRCRSLLFRLKKKSISVPLCLLWRFSNRLKWHCSTSYYSIVFPFSSTSVGCLFFRLFWLHFSFYPRVASRRRYG